MKKGVPVDEAAEGRVQMVLYHALETVRVSALCLQHVLPAAANKLLDDIAVPASQRNPMKFGRFGWRPRVISPEDTEKNEDCGRAQVSVAPFTKIVPPAAKPETKKNAPKEGPSRKERKAQYKKQMQMAEAN
jgi:methionyl-tRNA synthetase